MGPSSHRSSEILYVCLDCFADEELRRVIEMAAVADVCSFCGARSDQPLAAALDEVASHIKSFLEIEYEDPANSLPYDTQEGGYQGIVWTTHELLDDVVGLELPRDDDGNLMDALAVSIDRGGPEAWSERHPFSLGEPEQMWVSWKSFCEFVKHRRRYFFRSADQPVSDEPFEEVLTPDDLLARIAKHALDLAVIIELPPGTRIFRARRQNGGEQFRTVQDLGPPPTEKAGQNRMSPAGIVMFYGSEDVDTAVAEISEGCGEYPVGEFALLRSAWVLDLHEIPPLPSFFSETHGWERAPLEFLHGFARDIARPIERDDRVHIEFVPTQVVTEYFRTQVTHDGRPLDGISYSSSRNPGHRSYVLFAAQEDLQGDNSASSSQVSGVESDHHSTVWLALAGVKVIKIP